MTNNTRLIKIMTLTIAFALLSVCTVFAIDMDNVILLTDFNTSYSGANYHFQIKDDSLKIDITNNTELLKIWVRLRGAGISNLVDDDEIKKLKNNRASYNLNLDELNKESDYEITINGQYDEDGSFWGIYFGDKLVLRYDNGWGIILNKSVYQVNYNMYNGSGASTKVAADELSAIPESVKTQSNQIVQGITNDYDKVLAIHDWVAENIYYNYDFYYGQSKDIVYNSDGVLKSKKSVCEGYSNLFRDLVQAQNIKCIKVNGYALGVSTSGAWSDKTASGTKTNHAWNEVYIASLGRWMIVDCTWDSGNRYENGQYVKKYPNKHKYFDVTVEDLSTDHKIISSPKLDYETANTKPLDNIVSSWAKKTVDNAEKLGLIPSNMIKTYTSPITREKFCELALKTCKVIADIDDTDDLVKKLGTRDEKTFSDTSNTSIVALYQLGIINGTSDTTFSPSSILNRQQAAVILKNMAKLFNVEVESDSNVSYRFTDLDKAGSWAIDAIDFVSRLNDDSCNVGVMSGTSASTFSPLGSYTLEQSIVTMERIYHAVAK